MRAAWLILCLVLLVLVTPDARADDVPSPDRGPGPEKAEPWPILEEKLTKVRALLAGAESPPGALSEAWAHAGERSAVLYWQTENPATSFVEYGTSEAYGQQTEPSGVSKISGRPYWSQVHRLVDLDPDTLYHYRLVATGSDGSVVRSPDATFKTETIRVAVRIPEGVNGPPYVLNRPGAMYVVTQDLTAPASAFHIRAGGVVLDLNGHTVTYNAEKIEWAGSEGQAARAAGSSGILIGREARSPVRILNGTLRQGAGNDSASSAAVGANPIYAQRLPSGSEFAGLNVIWSGDGVSGLFLGYGNDSHIHHCVFEDLGTVVLNRHAAVSAVDGAGEHRYDHNLVKSTRQQGFRQALEAMHNEVYIDSYSTNSFGIHMATSRRKSEVAHNRVIGVGQHPLAYGLMGLFAPGSRLHDNLAIVECTRSGEEYGFTGSACVRTTWGTNNLDVEDNVLVGVCSTRPRGKNSVSGQTRTVWIGLPAVREKKGAWKGTVLEPNQIRGIVHGNVILAIGRDETAEAGAVCVVCKNESPNLVITKNLIVSPFCNAILSDRYGGSENHARFVDNVIRREGEHPNYFTIRSERRRFGSKATFLDNRYEGGATRESIKTHPKTNVVFQHELEIVARGPDGSPLGAAEVVIKDKAGTTVFQGRTGAEAKHAALVCTDGPGLAITEAVDPDTAGFVSAITIPAGALRVVLTEYVVTDAGREALGPYEVQVTSPAGAQTRTVDMTSDQRLEFRTE